MTIIKFFTFMNNPGPLKYDLKRRNAKINKNSADDPFLHSQPSFFLHENAGSLKVIEVKQLTI